MVTNAELTKCAIKQFPSLKKKHYNASHSIVLL